MTYGVSFVISDDWMIAYFVEDFLLSDRNTQSSDDVMICAGLICYREYIPNL
jgi:hypothetical protein